MTMTAKMWEHLEAIAKAEAEAAPEGLPSKGLTAAEIGTALDVTGATAGKTARALQDEGYVYDIVTHSAATRFRVSGRGRRALTERLGGDGHDDDAEDVGAPGEDSEG